MHEGARGHEAERSHSHFLYSTTERNYNQRIMGFIRNIMRRYVRISSF